MAMGGKEKTFNHSFHWSPSPRKQTVFVQLFVRSRKAFKYLTRNDYPHKHVIAEILMLLLFWAPPRFNLQHATHKSWENLFPATDLWSTPMSWSFMFTSSDRRYFKAYKNEGRLKNNSDAKARKKSCAFLLFVFCATFICISWKVASNCERESAHTEEINPERSAAKTIETAEYLTITFFYLNSTFICSWNWRDWRNGRKNKRIL